MKYSDKELLDEIRESAEEVGDAPTYSYFNERDGPSTKTVEDRFGAWTKAKRIAGVDNTGPYGKFPVNSDYFEKIDTQEKAYWLGVLYGDGSIINHSPADRVYLGMSDKEHVIKFQNALNASQSVKSKEDGTYCITITDQKIADDLSELGCDNDKTFSNTLPDLPNKNHQANFVRGLFDADGCFGVRGTWFRLTGASREPFEKLIGWLPLDATIDDGDGTFTLRVTNGRRVFELWNWLYPNGTETTPALERKIEKIPI